MKTTENSFGPPPSSKKRIVLSLSRKRKTTLVGSTFGRLMMTGWCSTPTLLLICSSFSRENGYPLLVCSSLSTAQMIFFWFWWFKQAPLGVHMVSTPPNFLNGWNLKLDGEIPISECPFLEEADFQVPSWTSGVQWKFNGKLRVDHGKF